MEEFLSRIPRRWIGALVGLVSALLIIWFGFWQLLFIALCVGVGYLVGLRFDGDRSVEQLIQRLFPSQ